MKEQDDYTDYAIPVHNSLMQKHQLFGVGEKAFYAILVFTLILTTMVSVYCIGLGILILIICRKLCKKEPMLLDFLFENLMQNDIYVG